MKREKKENVKLKKFRVTMSETVVVQAYCNAEAKKIAEERYPGKRATYSTYLPEYMEVKSCK